MRILLCCEFYAPSVGGVQEVMKQVAEHLVARGHEVTVATKKLPSRDFKKLNGVKIVEFDVSGNIAYGMTGELDAYRNFITSQKFDILMIKAAQQWTFDALWPILKHISIPKIFIPCGFSGLYNPEFCDYFKKLPEILREFDHLIFYASDYRDINFAKKHGMNNFSLVPNGASEIEFSVNADPSFREKHGIGENDFLLLTVGSFTGSKGHFEVVKAFQKAKLKTSSTLILNGNVPEFLSEANNKNDAKLEVEDELQLQLSFFWKIMNAIEQGIFFKKTTGKIQHYLVRLSEAIGLNQKEPETYTSIAYDINANQKQKKVLITDLSRSDLIQAFLAADLFVFASYIEYSPLVLYETAAAGTPFLSVPVGNAEEIACWTGAGQICKAQTDKWGNTKVRPALLAKHISRLARNREILRQMGENGRKNWADKFNWDKITIEYESVFRSVLSERTVLK